MQPRRMLTIGIALILVGIILFQLHPYPCWHYRQSLTVFYTQHLDGACFFWETPLLASLYRDGKLAHDCSDLAFTDTEGNALGFKVEVCDTSTGHSWVGIGSEGKYYHFEAPMSRVLIWLNVFEPPSVQLWMYYGFY